MAAPAYSASTGITLMTAAATPVTVSYPGSPSSGDLVIAHCGSRNSNNDTLTWTLSGGGWAKLGEWDTHPSTATGLRQYSQLFAKVIDAETSVDVSVDIYDNHNGVILHLFTSADDFADPPLVERTVNTVTSFTVAFTGTEATTTQDDSLALWVYGQSDNQSITATGGAGWTHIAPVNTADGSDATYGLAYKEMATAGATGAPSAEVSNGGEIWGSSLLELQTPAAPVVAAAGSWGWR